VEAVVGQPLSQEHVLPHREVLDALVWLGTGQKQARHLVRLSDGIEVRMYLTNVCDPQLLSLAEVAQLYARSFDIEMAFRVRKRVSWPAATSGVVSRN
jgi:IS4 transposase